MDEKLNKVFHCNLDLTIHVIGGKWKSLIMYHIGKSGTIRYGELKRKIPNINERVLSRQLRELEEHQLIKRKVYDEKPLKVEYTVTEIGKTLNPILDQLCRWGKEYNETFNYGEIEFEHEYND